MSELRSGILVAGCCVIVSAFGQQCGVGRSGDRIAGAALALRLGEVMKAVVYEGPRQVRVEDVADPVIVEPTDVLVRITTTNICGSDLHMYEGRTAMDTGRVLGHENLGEVVDTGAAVASVGVGDRVCLPFNISCGFCRNCEKGLTAFCLNTNPDPDMVGAAYGFAGM